jgi:hypothetical protein
MNPEENKEPFFIEGAAGGDEQPEQRTPIEAKEGVLNQTALETVNGVETLTSPKRVVSLTQIRTLDLLSEGEIEGLVGGEYKYVGRKGEIGYRSYEYIPYPSKTIGNQTLNVLRSIYWNEVPIVDKDNLFNFQQVDVQVTNGVANGSLVDEIEDKLTISRPLNERLRGPNARITANGIIKVIGQAEQFAKTYRIINKNCRAAMVNIRVNALSESIVKGEKSGDVITATINYSIYYKPIFTSSTSSEQEQVGPDDQAGYILGKSETIKGKISYGYIRSSRINFQGDYSSMPNFLGWQIKIFRTTPDSVQSFLRNATAVDSITEIYGESFCYPNSAIVAQKFSAEYFSQIPSRAFDARFLKIKVPSNYDPIGKSYDGVWDGTFKTYDDDYSDATLRGKTRKQWSDNPAWCYYDLITNPRYGLGKYIPENQIDKWTLYEIGQYCDTLVSDGFGGLEPRFTCNLYMGSREDAYKVVNDMASIFRAMTYYAAGSIYTSQDAEKRPIVQFTNDNVEDGNFSYASSSKRVRHSIAVVRYNDKSNFYRPAIEYVEDVDAVKKYGIRELETSAYGCVSKGQAIRWGRWALTTEALETETVSFVAGLEGSYLRPGDIIQTFDQYKKNKYVGGRTSVINDSGDSVQIILDREIPELISGSLYKFSLLVPTFNYEPSLVSGLAEGDIDSIRKSFIQTTYFSGAQVSTVSGQSTLNLRGSLFEANPIRFQDTLLKKNLVWAIEASGNLYANRSLNNQWETYRVVRIKEEEEGNRFTIDGIQYDETKFTYIESGLNLQDAQEAPLPSPISSIDLRIDVVPPSNVKGIYYNINPTNFSGMSSCLVYAKLGEWETGDFSELFNDTSDTPYVSDRTPDSNYLINILPITALSGVHIPFQNGRYNFRAYSRNSDGIPATVPAANYIDLEDTNALENFRISALNLEGIDEEETLQAKTSGIYTTDEPTFVWQAGFVLGQDSFSATDLTYRVTFRKSTSQYATIRATGSEAPGGADPYQPSNIIYYEETGLLPGRTDNLSYTLALSDNVQAFADYYLSLSQNITGVLREFDVVVEAHLPDGTTSAGGNFLTSSRGSITDSEYTNTAGYDILYVNNPRPSAISLTSENGLTACMLNASPSTVCTDQWFNAEGEVKLSVERGTLATDVVGGYIFSCPKSFTAAEAKAGKKFDNTVIRASEFTSVQNPITVPSNLFGYRSGYMAVGLYDTFDKDFRTYVRETTPEFDIVTGLNISNTVKITNRGGQDLSANALRAWLACEIVANTDSTIRIQTNSVGIASVAASADRIDYKDRRWTRLFISFEPDLLVGSAYNVSFDAESNVFYHEPARIVGNITIPEYHELMKCKVINKQQSAMTIELPPGVVRFWMGVTWDGTLAAVEQQLNKAQ